MTVKHFVLSTALIALACQGSPKVRPRDGSGAGSPADPARPGGGGGAGGGGGGIVLPTTPQNPPDAATAVSADANCGLQNFKLERRPAEMLLVLDRSGSMREPPMLGGLTSKWTETTPALHETIMKTAATVQWGLKFFPGPQFVACNVPDGIDVPPKLDNYGAIGPAITMATPNGTGTPTRYVIQKAVAYFQATASINARYIVLATDGEPNCADGMTNDLVDPDGAVEAVRAAAMAGFKTFVVGIATTMSDAHATLNRMAEAGGSARAGDPRYYPVSSRQDLINALSVITGQVSDCVFPLDKQPPSEDAVAVEVDGMRLVRDATKANGWDYGAANKTVEIYGAACERIKVGGADVKIIFGCRGEPIP